MREVFTKTNATIEAKTIPPGWVTPNRVEKKMVFFKTEISPKKTSMSLEDAIKEIEGQHITWLDVPGETLHEILTKVAEEIELTNGVRIPIPLLSVSELKKTRFTFYKNKTLGGLISAFQKSYPNKASFAIILDKAGVTPSAEDIIAAKKLKREIDWDRFYGKPLNTILQIAAIEREKPASMLTKTDLQKPFIFLEGSTLDNLILHTERIKRTTASPSGFELLLEKANIQVDVEDIISCLQRNRDVQWQRTLGSPLREFLQKITGVPIFLLTINNIFNRKFSVLNNRNLHGLYRYLLKHKEGKSTMNFLLDITDSNLNPQELFTAIKQYKQEWSMLSQDRRNEIYTRTGAITSIDETIKAFETKDTFWERIHPETQREIIENACNELGVLPPMLSKKLLERSFAFLDGHNLSSFYNYIDQKEKERRKTGKADVILAMLKNADVPVTIPKDQPSQERNLLHLRVSEDVLQKPFARHPILTREQEQTLFRYIHYGIPLAWLRQDSSFLDSFGDNETTARQKLELILLQSNTIEDVIIRCNYNFLYSISKNFGDNRLSYNRKVEVASDAMREAITKFDPESGYKFSSYCIFLMPRALTRVIAKEGYIVEVPVTIIQEQTPIKRLKAAYYKVFNREPSREELRQQAIANTNLAIPLIDHILDFLFLIAPKSNISSSNETTEIEASLRDQSVDVEEEAINKVLIHNAIQHLTAEEQLVLLATNGFYEDEGCLTHEEISKTYEIPLSQIPNLLTSAYEKLRQDPEMQDLGKERISSENVVFDATIKDKRAIQIKRITDSSLTSTSLNNYLAILDLHEKQIAMEEIASQLSLSISQTKKFISELREAGVWIYSKDSFTPLLMNMGLLSPEEVYKRSDLPTNRALYVSEDTLKLKEYLAPVSFKEKLSRFFPNHKSVSDLLQ